MIVTSITIALWLQGAVQRQCFAAGGVPAETRQQDKFVEVCLPAGPAIQQIALVLGITTVGVV